MFVCCCCLHSCHQRQCEHWSRHPQCTFMACVVCVYVCCVVCRAVSCVCVLCVVITIIAVPFEHIVSITVDAILCVFLVGAIL